MTTQYNADIETTTTRTGRTTVRYTDPINGKRARKTFRSAQLAGVFSRYLENCGSYWANSATASFVRAIDNGDCVIVEV